MGIVKFEKINAVEKTEKDPFGGPDFKIKVVTGRRGMIEIYDDNKRTLIFKYLVDKTGQNYDFTKFIFPKIIESKNKIFHFCVQNSDENNTSLGLFNAKEKIYGHNIQFDNKNVNGNIVFQIYARNQDLSFVDFYRVLLARMSQYKPDMLKFWSFLGIFWAYFMAIIFFIISNFKGKK